MRIAGLILGVLAIATLSGCSGYYTGEGERDRSWNHDSKINGGFNPSPVGRTNTGKRK